MKTVRTTLTLPMLLALALVQGCGRDHVASRDPNSSETENVLSRRVVLSNGQPAARVRVKLVPQGLWQQRLLQGKAIESDSLLTDDLGRVSIPKPSDSSWIAVVRAGVEGAFLPILPGGNDSVWTTGPIRPHDGNMAGTLPANASLCLRATTHCASIQADGSYHFDSLEPGTFTPMLRTTQLDTLLPLDAYRISTLLETARDSIYYTPDSLLLDNFQDGDANGLLHSWNLSAKWWIYLVNATSVPADRATFPSHVITDSAAPGNKALQLTVTTTGASGSFALLGLDLGMGTLSTDSTRLFADISHAQGIRFRIKGTGTVKVFLQTKATLENGDEQHLFHDETLTGDWQDLTITPDQFTAPVGSLAALQGLTYARAATRVSAIVFQFGVSGPYWLDDVRISGVRVLQLFDWNE